MAYMKVTFHLDGTGVYYDPNEPIHLDALLGWVIARRQNLKPIEAHEEPEEMQLPLMQENFGEVFVWCASALFLDGRAWESVWYWRSRFQQNRAELTSGNIRAGSGVYRDWQVPIPLVHCSKMEAYANGDLSIVSDLLRDVRYLGKKRAHGHGRIAKIDVVRMNEDYSLIKDGLAMRWLPDKNGTRLVRPIPPYWHPMGRVMCLDVMEEV